MRLAPGAKLGPYEILTPLGAGGMGEVYRARDTRLERSVAIKILSAQFSFDPVHKQRFEREASPLDYLGAIAPKNVEIARVAIRFRRSLLRSGSNDSGRVVAFRKQWYDRFAA
jgi:serine/threonine protein kinase